MSERGEDNFEPRLGRIRSNGSGRRAKSFLSRMASSVSRAGPKRGSAYGGPRNTARFGTGRRVIVKARIVRMAVSSAAALKAHLDYIRRESAMQAQDKGQLFDRSEDKLDLDAFAEKLGEDRHHFRFIVSPEDGAELTNMKAYVRDMMSNMERDMDTRLDWAAAIHHDTGHPHAHIVLRGKRDDGRDLVIPRAYMAHGFRERAEELVTLELGPQTQLEVQRKLARETQAHRLTRIDRHMIHRAAQDYTIKLADSPAHYRTLHAARLRTLQRLGLAEKAGRGTWRLAEGMGDTLRAMSERGDIIKTMNRALAGTHGRRMDAAVVFDIGDPDMRPVTGAVLRSGITGDGHDRIYAVIDGLDGRATYAELGSADEVERPRKGAIVSLAPHSLKPKSSDHTINTVAQANGGRYSETLHRQHDARARPDFVRAHVRRLEALRRGGHVTRSRDAEWQIPSDYLERAVLHEQSQARVKPARLELVSAVSLPGQIEAIGATWLDTTFPPQGAAFGFGEDVKNAWSERRAFLVKIGVLKSAGQTLTQEKLESLRQRDLQAAGKALETELRKPYFSAGTSGTVEGIYRQSIDRPSGRFAVIVGEHRFTLVPWRQVLERSRGLSVTGQMRGHRISWTIGRGRGLGHG